MEKRRGLSPGGRFPPSFIHQVIIITRLNKLWLLAVAMRWPQIPTGRKTPTQNQKPSQTSPLVYCCVLLSPVHPDAGAVWRFSLHGCFLHGGHPARPAHPYCLHASEVSAGLCLPPPCAHPPRPPFHRHPSPLPRHPLDNQDNQVHLYSIPSHGKVELRMSLDTFGTYRILVLDIESTRVDLFGTYIILVFDIESMSLDICPCHVCG